VFVDGEKYCRTAIEIDPQRHNSYKNLGLALQGQGKYAEAAACFFQAALISPPDYRSIAARATRYSRWRSATARAPR